MNDREQIMRQVSAYCEAVHTQNEADFRALWTGPQTCTLISITTLYTGLDSIVRDFLLNTIREKYSEIRLVAEDIEIRLHSDRLAIVIFRYHTECISRTDGSPCGIAGLETQVFVKEDDQWKLTHLHYSKG